MLLFQKQSNLPKSKRACVIGAGPNGLAAAILLARAGIAVDVLEAEPEAGGAARTLELTLPGFHHDFGSAVHPLAAGSPFFSSLPLADYGLEWIHSPAALAHPLEDGTAVTLERDLTDAESALGVDGKAWRGLMEPYARHWNEIAPEMLGPLPPLLPRHPFLLARFGLRSIQPVRSLANRLFSNERTRALFAGLGAHSFLSLDEWLSTAFAMLLGAAAHAVGWPIPRGGAQSITNALVGHLLKIGGTVKTMTRVERAESLRDYEIKIFDITPRQLLHIAGDQLTEGFKRKLKRYRYGSGVFKVDYALQQPIPWKSADCLRAATVHLGGTMAEIGASEKAVRSGRCAERPFVLLAQPSLFDSTRAPSGRHTAWAYCHVPHGSDFDMLERLENQIERFAPGFREGVLARHVLTPRKLEQMDSNLVGGDISGGELSVHQFLFRPTWRRYATSAPDIYLCSSSTPPGGGVHGMCGYHAAKLAVSRLQ
jgi:phytoene dehydrogenase-like protein